MTRQSHAVFLLLLAAALAEVLAWAYMLARQPDGVGVVWSASPSGALHTFSGLKSDQRFIWYSTEAFVIAMQGWLIFFLAPARWWLARLVSLVFLAVGGTYHFLEVAGCSLSNLQTVTVPGVAESACTATGMASYVFVYVVILIMYPTYLLSRLWWFTRSDTYHDHGNFTLYHRPRTLWQVLVAIATAPYSSKSRIVAGRLFGFRHGELVERQVPVDLSQYIVRERSGGPSLSEMQARVGTRWSLWRNCFTHL